MPSQGERAARPRPSEPHEGAASGHGRGGCHNYCHELDRLAVAENQRCDHWLEAYLPMGTRIRSSTLAHAMHAHGSWYNIQGYRG